METKEEETDEDESPPNAIRLEGLMLSSNQISIQELCSLAIGLLENKDVKLYLGLKKAQREATAPSYCE
jgi:hypothetical protein